MIAETAGIMNGRIELMVDEMHTRRGDRALYAVSFTDVLMEKYEHGIERAKRRTEPGKYL
jgi:hypothetical protein